MGGLSPEERPVIGALVNEVRDELECLINERQKELKRGEIEKKLATENIDVTMPSKRTKIGSIHPITQVISEIEEIFLGMGFKIEDGPEVERTHYVFEQLNMPEWHPARDTQDTFYVNDKVILRTQTSSIQARTMEKQEPPIKMICPGKV